MLFMIGLMTACGNLLSLGGDDEVTDDADEETPFGGGGNNPGDGGDGNQTPLDTGSPITDTGSGLDDDCLLGVAAFCICAEGKGLPCDKKTQVGLYVECLYGTKNGQIVECFGDFVEDNAVDCDAALSACF